MEIPSTATPPWSPAKRFGFRLAFIYLGLYTVTLFTNTLPLPDWMWVPWGGVWDHLVPWVGKLLWGIDATNRPSGSGDTSFDWVQLFCFLGVAVVGALVWTLLDRRRPDYRRLAVWLLAWVRAGVGATMIVYGAFKFIPSQFGSPTLDRLLQPFGDASPMGLLWTFMATSASYTSFTGFVELMGGLLLIMRRTTLLGALISVGAMSQVAMLNLCYDVPVKLMSLHMVALALLLAWPDRGRLVSFFLLRRPTEPAPLPRLLTSPKWHRLALVLRSTAALALAGMTLYGAAQGRASFGTDTPRSPLRGVWDVVELETDGQARPPLTTDGSRPKLFVFDYPQGVGVVRMNDERLRLRLKLDEEKHTLALTSGRDPNWPPATLSFERPQPDVLLASGTFEGQQVKARLVRRAGKEFLLESRGFHWVSEQPFNR